MTVPVSLNCVRRGFYMDSVALMRHSRTVGSLPGIVQAAMMIGSATNKSLMEEAGLLTEEGRTAGPNDLIIAICAETAEGGIGALDEAEALLDRVEARGSGSGEYRPRSIDTAVQALPGANLALVSVPGEFAADEARKAMRRGLHVMMFSDNVPLEEEIALKREARERGLLMMGPDCGTAIINGVPLGFANAVPRGPVGIVAASGTGLQEVATLLARHGTGISHGIGVGGRDLKEGVGGIMTLMAIDALDRDPATERIVLISKPPAPAAARSILDRVAESSKRFTICFLGLGASAVPDNARVVATLTAAAEDVLGSAFPSLTVTNDAAAAGLGSGRRVVRGLYCGGTLCAEAQVVLCGAGLAIRSNAPIEGALPMAGLAPTDHAIVDLGADEYTVGRPHPMIDPAIRDDLLRDTLAAPEVAVVLLDVVIGTGAHDDPAGSIAAAMAGKPQPGGPLVLASVTGTEEDRQVYSEQAARLARAGVLVAPSNSRAAEIAAAIVRSRR